MAIAIDPVCGMEVDTSTSQLSLEHDGTTYWFCGKGCLLEFKDDPERFLAEDSSRPCDGVAVPAGRALSARNDEGPGVPAPVRAVSARGDE
jgi:YHS domain-containing protein